MDRFLDSSHHASVNVQSRNLKRPHHATPFVAALSTRAVRSLTIEYKTGLPGHAYGASEGTHIGLPGRRLVEPGKSAGIPPARRRRAREINGAREISPVESVGLKAHENTFAVVVASALGIRETPPLSKHAIR